MISKIPLRNGDYALEFSKVAVMYGIRRDWAPYPHTVAWTMDMQRTLFGVAEELEAEALALLQHNQGEA